MEENRTKNKIKTVRHTNLRVLLYTVSFLLNDIVCTKSVTEGRGEGRRRTRSLTDINLTDVRSGCQTATKIYTPCAKYILKNMLYGFFIYLLFLVMGHKPNVSFS